MAYAYFSGQNNDLVALGYQSVNNCTAETASASRDSNDRHGAQVLKGTILILLDN